MDGAILGAALFPNGYLWLVEMEGTKIIKEHMKSNPQQSTGSFSLEESVNSVQIYYTHLWDGF